MPVSPPTSAPFAVASAGTAIGPTASRSVAKPDLRTTRANILAADAAARALYSRLHDIQVGSDAAQRQFAGFRKRNSVVQRMTDRNQLNQLQVALQKQIKELRAKVKASVPERRPVGPMEDLFNQLSGFWLDVNRKPASFLNHKSFEARDLAAASPVSHRRGKAPATAKPKVAATQQRGLKTVTARQEHEAIQTLATGRAGSGSRQLALDTLRQARRRRLELADQPSPHVRQRMLALNERLFDALRTALDAPALRGVRWDPRIWNAVAHGALVQWAPNAYTTVRQGDFRGLPFFHAVLNRDRAPLVAQGDAAAVNAFATIVTSALNLNNNVYVRRLPHNVFDEILRRLNETPDQRHLMVAALAHLSNPGRDRNHPLESWLTDFRAAVDDWRSFPDNDSLMRSMASPEDIEGWVDWLDDTASLGGIRWVTALYGAAHGSVDPSQVLPDARQPRRSGTPGGGGYHSGRPPSPGPGGGTAGAAAVVSGRQRGGATAVKPGHMSIGALGSKPNPGLGSAPGRATVQRPRKPVHDGL